MVSPIIDKILIDLIRKNDQIMVLGEISDPLEFHFAENFPGRISRSVDNNRFCVSGQCGHEVIRFEAWETVSVPPEARSLRAMTSTSRLGKRR